MEDEEEDNGTPPSIFDDKGVRAFLDGLPTDEEEDEPPADDDDSDDDSDLTDDERKVLADFKGDRKALAKAYANLRELQSRQGTELGELRQKIEQLQPREEKKPEEDENSLWKTNEYGVKYIPDEHWRNPAYISAVVEKYIEAGYSEAEAHTHASIYINQQYNNHKAQVAQETQEAMRSASQAKQSTEEETAQAQAQEQIARMESVTDAMANELLLSYPEETVVAILQEVEERAKKYVAEQFRAGNLSVLEATHPNIVEPLYYDTYSEMMRDGTVRKLLTLEKPRDRTAPMMRPTIPGGAMPAARVTPEMKDAAQRVRRASEMQAMTEEDQYIFQSVKSLGLSDEAAMDAVKKTRGNSNGR